MFVKMLKGKIHRAVVTDADLNYSGSITIDQDLMDAAGLLSNQVVLVADINNRTRLETMTSPSTPRPLNRPFFPVKSLLSSIFSPERSSPVP